MEYKVHGLWNKTVLNSSLILVLLVMQLTSQDLIVFIS